MVWYSIVQLPGICICDLCDCADVECYADSDADIYGTLHAECTMNGFDGNLYWANLVNSFMS